MPEPGGWNRFSLEVPDLAAAADALRAAGVHFRNDIVTGVGGKQVLIDDPSGNPAHDISPALRDRLDQALIAQDPPPRDLRGSGWWFTPAGVS